MYIPDKKTQIEIVKPWSDFNIRYALFDFDGTVSLIREGWQEIMIPYFTEVLQEADPDGDPREIRHCAREFVDLLTGKQTIFQCIRLKEEVQKRGGTALEPIAYKREYLRRLELHIRDRKESLKSGMSRPQDYQVPGVFRFLDVLRKNHIRCYLASGTDEEDVLFEARLLGLDDMFDGGIHGAHAAMTECSKELVIRDMVERERMLPNQMVSFGDGYVEIELTKKLGGLAIGVASDEKKRCRINEWKRKRLIHAGARAVIPDFTAAEEIMKMIRGDSDAVCAV